MAKISAKNCRSNKKNSVAICTESKSIKKKAVVGRENSPNQVCSHRTPTQLHASIYIDPSLGTRVSNM